MLEFNKNGSLLLDHLLFILYQLFMNISNLINIGLLRIAFNSLYLSNVGLSWIIIIVIII